MLLGMTTGLGGDLPLHSLFIQLRETRSASGDDAAYGFDVAQDLIQRNGVVAASVWRVGLGENDEAMDAGGGISVDGVAVEGADGSDGDFKFS